MNLEDRHRKSRKMVDILGPHSNAVNSDNMSKFRITQRAGLFALGRTSSKIKRVGFNALNQEHRARAKEDLNSILQLVTKGKLQSTPGASLMSTSPVSSSGCKSNNEEERDWDSLKFETELDSSSDYDSSNEEKSLKDVVPMLSKGFREELVDILNDENKNYEQESKQFLKSVYQQRFAKTDLSFMLFSDTTFQIDQSSCSSSKSQEPVTASLSGSSIKCDPKINAVEECISPNEKASTTPSLPEILFSFSPASTAEAQLLPMNFDQKLSNVMPSLSFSPSERGDCFALKPELSSSSYSSPLPRFLPNWLFKK